MKNNFYKNALKVFVDYVISFVIFAVFLMIPFGLAKENFYRWLPIYSFAIFLLMFLIIFSDMKKLAEKEKRPQYNINHYPLKGLLIGLVGVLPIVLIEIIYMFLIFEDAFSNRIKHLILNTLLGPLYTFINVGNGTIAAYVFATALVPLIAMLGYLSGYYNFQMPAFIRKSSKKTSLK